MTLLSAKGFGKSHGAHVCFEDVSFTVASGARIGLIGPNGCGKTTFLRALEGATDHDGLLTRRRGLEIARLEQNPVFAADDTPRSALAAATERWRRAERDLDARRASLATLQGDELSDAIEALAELEARHEAGGGESMERRAETLLHGVGLAPAQFDQPVATLSGGERCRVALARLLIHEPDLWLLDEPTNHLDLAGIAFLERFLKASRAAVILVSHDRRLLDRIATEIWNFENSRIDRYPGNYTQSRALREQKRLVQWREWEKQRDFVKKQEWFINKWRAGTRSRQAQSRMKRLARIELVDQPDSEARLAALDLKLSRRLGDLVLETRGLTVGFPGRTLFSGLDLTLVPGEILGIVGPNGAGKSSFLRVVEGELAPLSGTFRLGPTVVPGRLGQHETFPDENRTPQQFLQDANLGADDQDRRDKLGAMLFSGDAAQRPIRALSGGEKKRLMLTRLLLEGHNVLFLDEPTNHLDVQSSEAVTLALSAYEGTVVTVSHDRYFLDEVADRILWLEDGSWRVTPGGFAEAEKARERARALAAEKENPPTRARAAAVSAPPEAAADAAERPYRSWKTSKIEQHITKAEARREEINASFADPGIYRDGGRMRALTAELARLQAELAALEHEYGYR